MNDKVFETDRLGEQMVALSRTKWHAQSIEDAVRNPSRYFGKAYTGLSVIKLRGHWQGRGSRKGTLPFTKCNKYKKLHGISEYSYKGVPRSFKRRRYC